MELKKSTTSQIVQVFFLDTTSVIGAGKTGLAYNTSGLTCYTKRNRASASAAVTLVNMTLGTFTDSGFKEVDATHMPGLYEFGVPDVALATGSDGSTEVTVMFMVSGAVTRPLRFDLIALDKQDAVRAGLTALPNAAAEAVGGLFTRGTGAGQINQDANGRVDTNVAAWRGTQPNTLQSGRVDGYVGAYASGQVPLQPTVAGRTLDVSAGGEAGIDWANVGSPTTTVGLSGTTVKTAADVEADTQDLQARLPAALVSGKIDAHVSDMAAGAITAAAIATGAVDADALASDALAAVAASVLDADTADHDTAGTIGAQIGAVGDPLALAVPGVYAAGTAGYKLGLLGSGAVTVSTPNAQSGDLSIIRGDDYTVSSGRVVPEWSSDDWMPFSLTTATSITLRAQARYGETVFEKAGAAVSDTLVRVELTSEETGGLAVGRAAYRFDLEAVLATGDVVTLAQGHITVVEDVP